MRGTHRGYAPLAGATPPRSSLWRDVRSRSRRLLRLDRDDPSVGYGPGYRFRSPSGCADCAEPCAQVAIAPSGRAVLLTGMAAGEAVAFSPAQWEHLVAAIKAGEFDI
ncbi:hypothetical protein SMC26_39030 [Actinomadura fulvescens]|uniref:DUF397 domain-containing protein n=1 Tax=Actinomadura fulvescens TaxID=46160 RepID=A0ABP6D7V4_9ACTN